MWSWSCTCPAGLTHDQAERLRRIADTCPVKRALVAGFTFDQRILVDEHPDADAKLATVNGTSHARAAGGQIIFT